MQELKVNPLFRDKIPPLSKEEFERLEQNILKDGKVREPIIAWNGTIIDGHNRYSICQKHPEIPFTVEEKDFADEYEAIAWMCSNQLGRRNITAEQKAKLIQAEHDAVLKTEGGQLGNTNASKNDMSESDTSFSDKRNMTRKAIANEHHITESAVRDAVFWGRGVDAAEEVSPGFTNKILSGEIKATKKAVSDLRKADPKERKQMVEEIINPKPKTSKEILKNMNKSIESLTRESKPNSQTVEDLLNQLNSWEDDWQCSIRNLFERNRELAQANKEKFYEFFQDLVHDLNLIIKEFNLK